MGSFSPKAFSPLAFYWSVAWHQKEIKLRPNNFCFETNTLRQILRAFCVPGNVLVGVDIVVNKAGKGPCTISQRCVGQRTEYSTPINKVDFR